MQISIMLVWVSDWYQHDRTDTLFLVSDIIMWPLELYKIIFLEIKKYTLNLLYEKCQSVFVLTVYFI